MESKSTQKPILIAGSCSIEGRIQAHEISSKCSELADKYGFDYYFKGSFDKANRTSVNSKRGIGIERAIDIFAELKELDGCKITTDIHEPWQAEKLADVVDIIQIPAYLCRQTDLLVAAGNTFKTVNIKKGQFVDGSSMIHAINKVKSTGNNKIMLLKEVVCLVWVISL